MSDLSPRENTRVHRLELGRSSIIYDVSYLVLLTLTINVLVVNPDRVTQCKGP